MSLLGLGGGSHGGASRPLSRWPLRTFSPWACPWGLSCCFAQDGKVSLVSRYFHQGFCYHRDQRSYLHSWPPGPIQWGRRHSEPLVTLPGPLLGLTRRASEPTDLPSVAVGWDWAGTSWAMETDLEGLGSQNEELGGSSWKFLLPSPADGDPSYAQESQPRSDPVQELVVPLQSMDLEVQQRERESRGVVCGICMEKVWDKPEAQRLFGILPSCSHAHCLGCLRTWRRRRRDFPLDVVKACPQCRVHSSYIIPHKFWVNNGAEKDQLIRNFKARTSQIRCWFYVRGNGRCPFKSDCIYLHQRPHSAPSPDPPGPASLQPASGSQVPGPTVVEDGPFLDRAMAFWDLELQLDPSSSYRGLL